MSILPQLRPEVKAEAVSDEARGAFYVMKSADGNRFHEVSQTAYMTLCMLKGETEFESWMEQVQQTYPMVKKHHLEDLLEHMKRNDFLLGAESGLEAEPPPTKELSIEDEPPAPPALADTAGAASEFLAGPSTPRPEVTGVTRPPPDPGLTFEAPPLTAPGAAAEFAGEKEPASDAPPKKMGDAAASNFDNLDVEKTDPGRTGLLTTVDNQNSAPEPGLTLNTEDVPNLSDEADSLSIADDDEPPEPPELAAAFGSTSFTAPETSGFDLGEILDAQSNAAHAPFPEPENPLVIDEPAAELPRGSADDPIKLPSSGEMSAALGPQAAAAEPVQTLGARLFANVVVEKSAFTDVHKVTSSHGSPGSPAQGVHFYEFEFTLAKLFDGSRNVAAVQSEVEKLGYPLSAIQVEQFALTLHSFGLIEALGDITASEIQPLLPWKNGPQLQSNVHDWLQEEQGLFQAAILHFRSGNVDAAIKEVDGLLKCNPERAESNALKEMLTSLSLAAPEKNAAGSEFEPPALTNSEFLEPRPVGVMPGESRTPPPEKKGGVLVKVMLFAAALLAVALGGGMLVERETETSFAVTLQAAADVEVKATHKAVVASVEVEVGQDVKKGDVLVRFVEPPKGADEITTALQADVAFYKKLSDGKEGKRLRMSIYRAKGKVKKELKSAKTKYRVVERSGNRLDDKLQKIREKKSGFEQKQAKASTEKGKKYYSKLLKKEEKKILSVNKKLGVVKTKLAKYSEAQALAEAKITRLSGDLAAAQQGAEQKLKGHLAMLAGGKVAPLTASTAGKISKVHKEKGAQVGPGQTLVSLGGAGEFTFKKPPGISLHKEQQIRCGDVNYKVNSLGDDAVDVSGEGAGGDVRCQIKGGSQPWTLWLFQRLRAANSSLNTL
ncbi:MAG: hypothetical protein GY822_15520 [Deltaproteobacteria bacterium]|nr:hypothetical protein [Deltaproteobacteria bacterium]